MAAKYQEWILGDEHIKFLRLNVSDDLAARLFDDNNLSRAWAEIAKALHKMQGHQQREILILAYWQQIMMCITNAYAWTLDREAEGQTQGEIVKRYQEIATKARELYAVLHGSKLDHRLYYWGVFNPPGFDEPGKACDADPVFKYRAAHPHLSRVLQHVENEAKDWAKTYEKGIQSSKTAKHKERLFIRYLARDFKLYLGAELHGTIAKITAAAFGSKISKDFVKDCINKQGEFSGDSA